MHSPMRWNINISSNIFHAHRYAFPDQRILVGGYQTGLIDSIYYESEARICTAEALALEPIYNVR